MIFLDVEDLLYISTRVVGGPVEVRDIGLLDAAAARPRASAFGSDAYPSVHLQAAALVHSVVRNHALIDGNKRLGLAALLAFYGMNGHRLTLTNDEAYQFIVDIASGSLDEVSDIAQRLAGATKRAT